LIEIVVKKVATNQSMALCFVYGVFLQDSASGRGQAKVGAGTGCRIVQLPRVKFFLLLFSVAFPEKLSEKRTPVVLK
jgi:hypothetical protein